MLRTTSRFAIPFALLGLALWSQAPPAPSTDRVGFPTGYDKWDVLYTFDRQDNRQVRTIYGNREAASISAVNGMNYAYGSILVMETWPAVVDAQGSPVLDANGRFQKNPSATPTLFTMRKERGFGADYGPNRNGEWEYVAYRPDGTYATRPEATAACAICHLQAGALPDWTFRVLPLYLRGGSGALVDAAIKDYKFVPGELRVKSGAVVTFYNDDLVEHTVTDVTPGGGDSGRMAAGKSLSIKFTTPGEFNFRCTLHNNMRGKIIVEP